MDQQYKAINLELIQCNTNLNIKVGQQRSQIVELNRDLMQVRAHLAQIRRTSQEMIGINSANYNRLLGLLMGGDATPLVVPVVPTAATATAPVATVAAVAATVAVPNRSPATSAVHRKSEPQMRLVLHDVGRTAGATVGDVDMPAAPAAAANASIATASKPSTSTRRSSEPQVRIVLHDIANTMGGLRPPSAKLASSTATTALGQQSRPYATKLPCHVRSLSPFVSDEDDTADDHGDHGDDDDDDTADDVDDEDADDDQHDRADNSRAPPDPDVNTFEDSRLYTIAEEPTMPSVLVSMADSSPEASQDARTFDEIQPANRTSVSQRRSSNRLSNTRQVTLLSMSTHSQHNGDTLRSISTSIDPDDALDASDTSDHPVSHSYSPPDPTHLHSPTLLGAATVGDQTVDETVAEQSLTLLAPPSPTADHSSEHISGYIDARPRGHDTSLLRHASNASANLSINDASMRSMLSAAATSTPRRNGDRSPGPPPTRAVTAVRPSVRDEPNVTVGWLSRLRASTQNSHSHISSSSSTTNSSTTTTTTTLTSDASRARQTRHPQPAGMARTAATATATETTSASPVRKRGRPARQAAPKCLAECKLNSKLRDPRSPPAKQRRK